MFSPIDPSIPASLPSPATATSQPAAASQQVNIPAPQSPADLSVPPSLTKEEREHEAKMKSMRLQQTIWINTLPNILEPLRLPQAASQMKLCDLMSYLMLSLIQDLFSHQVLTPENNDYCLEFMAMFSEDPYDATSIENLNPLLELIEKRKTEVYRNPENYKDLKRALFFLIKSPGCRGRDDQKLNEILEPGKLKILCTADQDSSGCRNFLNVIENFLCHNLEWMNKDLKELNDNLRSCTTNQNKNEKLKDEFGKADILYKNFKKYKKDIEKLLALIQSCFSSTSLINPSILLPLLESLKKSINLAELNAKITKRFLNNLGIKNIYSQQSHDKSVSEILKRKGVPPEFIPTLLEADSSEIEVLEAQIPKDKEEKDIALVTSQWIKWRDEIRADLRGKANNAGLKDDFLQRLRQTKFSSRRVTKKVMAGQSDDFNQKMETEKHVASVIDRVSKSLKVKRECLILIQPLIALIDAKVSSLVCDRKAIALQASEALFNEEQIKLPRVRKKVFEETVVGLDEEDLPEEEEVKQSHTIAQPSVLPLIKPKWQLLHEQLQSPVMLEKWKTEHTTIEMLEFSKICMRHASFHYSLLCTQIKLMLKAREAHHTHYIPLFSRMLARSCSLITEQLLTAKLTMRDNVAKLKHYHLTLAEGQISAKDNESWSLLQAVDGGEIFHRYPHQFERRCKEQKLTTPLTLKWLLDPRSCSYHEMFQLAENTLNFIGKLLPVSSTKGLIDGLTEENKPSPFSQHFKNTLGPICGTLDVCMKNAEKILQDSGINESAHWRDVIAQLQGLQLSLTCLIDFPHAETLLGLGDILLSQVQYLDELIENGFFMRNHGFLLDSHDLEAFRLLKNSPPEESEQLLIADLNGDYGTQYPHRFVNNENRIPKTIKWRFEAARFTIPGKDFDREAMEHDKERPEGFKEIKGGKTNDKRHPLFDLHDDLTRWISGMVVLSDRRLTEFLRQ